MKSLNDLNKDQLDVFREIGNIGAGNATTALASILDKRLEMSVPNVQIVPFDEISNLMGGPETIIVGVLVSMTGNLNGYILMVLDQNDALKLLNTLMDYNEPPVDDVFNLTEVDLSALREITNILVGAYISAISSMTGLDIVPTVPDLTIDMAAAIMSVLAIEYGKIGDSVLFLQMQFSDATTAMAGHFFLIPDIESYGVMLKALGMGE